METAVLNGMQVLAMASTQEGGKTNSGSFEMIGVMVLVIALMYFLTIRPQKKRERERQEMLKRIKVGDKVRSIGGILGTVSAVSESTVMVAVSDKVTLEFVREAVILAEEPSDKSAQK